MKRFLAIATLIAGCGEAFPDHVNLVPSAADVEFATEPPGPDAYKLVGEVIGVAAAHDPEAAQEAARNDIRNKAAAMGASLVTIDEDTGEALLLQDKTKVKLVGRAYRAVD